MAAKKVDRSTTVARRARPLVMPDVFQPVVLTLATRPAVTVEPGWGEGNVALKVRAQIFAMYVRGDLVAKLPKGRVDALVAEAVGTRFDPRRNGRVMKEWLVVSDGGANWIALAEEAYAFVATGTAKRTARRRG